MRCRDIVADILLQHNDIERNLRTANSWVQRRTIMSPHRAGTTGNARYGLFDGDGLGQVAGLVDVLALGLGQRRREYLKWDRGEQRLEKH